MIEVLKHSEKPKTTIVTTKCPECGCIFRFNADEDTYHTRIFCEDRIDCPDCGHVITVRDTSCWSEDTERIICPDINYGTNE